METTFISIHDLSLDARILYVSDSITDILGYSPQNVVGRSCWEYFHPDEIPFARAIHGRGVQLDKAAVLNYCQIKSESGRWVGCECVFTIVHDVMVGCTSIYRRGMKSQKRAVEAPIVRQLFSSSPRDPRYHMLGYLSAKFSAEPKPRSHEPRAAFFLNRFTRTLPIMYATNGLSDVLDISAGELCGKSFYYCIQENCLQEAVKCLESAKANDSIAYLRFWFRDPRQDDPSDHEATMDDPHNSSEDDEDEGGVHLRGHSSEDVNEGRVASDSSIPQSQSSSSHGPGHDRDGYLMDQNSHSSSGDSAEMNGYSNDTIFDRPVTVHSSSSSVTTPEEDRRASQPYVSAPRSRIELEAVVSCTSDGLVVILRRARPIFPQLVHHNDQPVEQSYANGLFASPWAADPILPPRQGRPYYGQPNEFQASLTPSLATSQVNSSAVAGPPWGDFMNSIREVAVFAWSLTGINGSLAQYSRGKPRGESQPPGGFPIWDPNSNADPEADRHNGFSDNTHRRQTDDWLDHQASHISNYKDQGHQEQAQSGQDFSDHVTGTVQYHNQVADMHTRDDDPWSRSQQQPPWQWRAGSQEMDADGPGSRSQQQPPWQWRAGSQEIDADGPGHGHHDAMRRFGWS
ncbi:PAS domain [Lasallia pustulata]|uniref:PAS domain n=1 Tax=Lasallia pustulata TaxID=136370 RepID=A0A1W5DD92_9LECA|nr:PAS domain [Lasallia pustulata]